MKRLLNAAAAVALMSSVSAANAETTMGIVVKIGGIPWFNAMEEGIKERADLMVEEAFHQLDAGASEPRLIHVAPELI